MPLPAFWGGTLGATATPHMCSSPNNPPFGAPGVKATAIVSSLSSRDALPPDLLLEHLRSNQSRAGLVLLESGGNDPGSDRLTTTRRSVVVTRPLLRLTLKEGKARVVALVEDAKPLLRPLAERLRRTSPEVEVGDAELSCSCPRPHNDPGTPDAERLKETSCLDTVRALAGLLGDRSPGATLPPGAFGAFSYEIIDTFETLPTRRPDPLDEPDLSLVLAGDMVLHDLENNRVEVVTRGLPWEESRTVRARHDELLNAVQARGSIRVPPTGTTAADYQADVDDKTFEAGVQTLLDEIGRGEIFQAVLSRGLAIDADVDSLEVYRALRASNPSPYMFHMDLGDGDDQDILLGSSPETFLRVDRDQIEIRPIAGTVPRGLAPDGSVDEDLDNRLAISLLLDPKEQAEHAMLLDLARNDVARVSTPGTTSVVEQFAIEKYSQVQHIVSRVQGRLRPGLDALHAYRAAANMGTLTGAPKVRAMELIRELEPTSRGFYGGCCGYLLQNGDFDSCIVIRSLRKRASVYHTRTGAGIVWDSRPESELLETEAKARAVRIAIASAQGVAP